MFPSVECIDNSGFEDQLTAGVKYYVVTITGGSFEVVNDNGDKKYYGRAKFKVV